MNFSRKDYSAEVDTLRVSRVPASRAKGDNFHFEENVGADRLGDFEAFPALDPGLIAAAADYFYQSVQGTKQNHVPSTFRPINARALMSSAMSGNQKLLTLVKIDGDLTAMMKPHDLSTLQKAVRTRDFAGIDPLIRVFDSYEGARPVFACFKSEIAADLREPDWLWRYLCRLGLGHFPLAPGETGTFALMEYLASEVLRQTTMTQPFAVPTVLEARNSEFFFPAPAEPGYGYTVDLDQTAGRPAIREILHIRLQFQATHVARVEQLVGPTPTVHLASARDTHLGRLRAATGRADYGEMMAGQVD